MNHKKGTSRAIGALVVVTLSFFLIHRFPAVAPGVCEKVASYATYPFLCAQFIIVEPVSRMVTTWSQFFTLSDAYTKLATKHEQAQAELVALKAVHFMAEETQEIREFAQQYDVENALLVRILTKSFGAGGHFFLVDAGAYKGVVKDTAVVYKNCLVGKITEVYPYMSKVVLITDPSCKVAAYCDQTKTHGIYEGTYSFAQGALTHVGHLHEVSEGDMVFTSGEGLVFPKGFGIGTISSFCKNEGNMQYAIVVTPLLDVATLSYCYILQKNKMAQELKPD